MAVEGSVTFQVAEAPALTVVVGVEKAGGWTAALALSISNCMVFETRPADGRVTVTGTMPGAPSAEAGTVAVSRVGLTNCVTSAVVPKVATELMVKPEPWRVRVRPAEPAPALAGVKLLIVMTGGGTYV